MIHLTNTGLRRLTTPVEYEEGKNLYKEKRVLSILREGDRIRGRVKGDSQYPFDITIFIYPEKIKGVCTCGVSSFCRHLAAVFFKYITEQVPRKKGEDLFGFIKNPLPPGQDRYVELEKKQYNKNINKAMDTLFTVTPFRKSSKKTPGFLLGFQLEGREEYKIMPCLVTLRQDGTRGRVTGFHKEKKYVPVGRELEFILEIVLEGKKGVFSILFYLELFKISSFPLYNPGSSKKISLVKSSRVEVRFRFSGFLKEGIPVFKPVAVFMDDDGRIVTELEDFDCLSFSGEGYCFYKPWDGLFVYHLSLKWISGLLKFIRKYPAEYGASDIRKLKKKIPAAMKSMAAVHFNHDRLRIRRLPPVLFINPEAGASGTIHVGVSFSYDGHTRSYQSEEPYIEVMDKEGELVLLERSPEREDEAYDGLFEFFLQNGADCFDDAAFIPGVRGSDFRFNLSLFGFLTRFGQYLLDREVNIRIGGMPLKKTRGKILLQTRGDMDWLDIKLCREDGKELYTGAGVMEQGLVRCAGELMLLSGEDFDLLRFLREEGMDESGRLSIPVSRFSVLEKINESLPEDSGSLISRALETARTLRDVKSIETHEIPGGLQCTLREYQVEGYNWLHFLRTGNLGGCLADDMGLGKTVQTLSLLLSLKEQGLLQSSLLVVPVVTLVNWEREIDRFAPALSFIRHAGNKRDKNVSALQTFDIILVSYQTLRCDIEMFVSRKWYYLILDEAHYIKNAASQTFKAIRSLKALHRLSLTGTPMENTTPELWSQMEFLNPGLLGTEQHFKRTFVRAIEKDNDSVASGDLRQRVSPFIFRRKKQDVLTELPGKEEIVYYSEMEPEQREVYSNLLEHYRNSIGSKIREKGFGGSTIEILEALLRLRQAVLFPGLVDADYEDVISCKFESLKNLVEEIVAEGHKVLIFSQFVKSLERIRAFCVASGFKHAWLTGATGDRQKEIDRFRKGDDVPVFLLSLKAGGVGINLTEANYVILFDPWWNPAVECQAVDRAHRMGQTRKLTVYKLIVKDSIEEKVLLLQERKKELVEQLITTGGVAGFTETEITNLFD